ncbi:MAG: hypothetical protein NTU88_16195 [Armatimonadetes bacterium]|nr:hypothetical protein [Armatimonadota bacterium]
MFAEPAEAVVQYIAPLLVSLKELPVQRGTMEFTAELLQHLLDPHIRWIRGYGLYSSQFRGTWLHKPSPRPPGPG